MKTRVQTFNCEQLCGLSLEEGIKLIPAAVPINISAKSSFLFIGTVSEWRRDRYTINLCAYEASLAAPKSLWKQLLTLCGRINAARIDEDGKAEEELLGTFSDTLQKFGGSFDKAVGYVPLENRKIKEVYWRIDHSNSVNIIVEGDEIGKFWTRGEYLEWKKSKSKDEKGEIK